MIGASRPSKKDRQEHVQMQLLRQRAQRRKVPPLAVHLLNPRPELSIKEHATTRLCLNVGGANYRFRGSTILKRSPDSFLYRFLLMKHADRLQNCHDYLENTESYFFERSAVLFDSIYQYYVSGQCHKPSNVCLKIFLEELDFWHLVDEFPECCFPPEVSQVANGTISVRSSTSDVDEFLHVCCGETRRAIWNLIEVPESSIAAHYVSLLSLVAVLLSNIGLVLGSIPDLQVEIDNAVHLPNGTMTTVTVREPHPFFEYVEYFCIIWFTIEYLGKIVTTPYKRKVFLQILNMIDLIAIVPFYIELTLMLSGINTAQLQELKGALLVVRILRVLRVVRLFKLGRYSSGLRAFAKTLHHSREQLGMLVVVLATGIMFFSTLVFFLEKDEPETHFVSIPASFWWCIVTMTTVGYGDYVPMTIGGKLVGSCAIAAGVLVLALPITIIVDNFMKVQEEEQEAQVCAQLKLELEQEVDEECSIGGPPTEQGAGIIQHDYVVPSPRSSHTASVPPSPQRHSRIGTIKRAKTGLGGGLAGELIAYTAVPAESPQ